jgi:Mg/Co/Ni transporter MgtE
MTPQLKIATEEFNRAADVCVQHSERTYDKFINSRGLHVAKKAIEDTEKADASRIVYQLAGNVRTRISVSRKTGKRKTTRQYDATEASLAARIINARRVNAASALCSVRH